MQGEKEKVKLQSVMRIIICKPQRFGCVKVGKVLSILSAVGKRENG